MPDPRTIPKNEIKEIIAEAFEIYGYQVLQYSPSSGLSKLVKEVINFVYRTRGLRANLNNVIIVSGSQQGLELVSRIFIDPGDIVVVEEPTYLLALNVFKLRKARIVSVPVDDEGMDVNVLEDIVKDLKKDGKKPKIVYTMPVAQNPTGVTMSINRRKHLLELAEKYNFIIVEDDAYGLLSFDCEQPPIASLMGLNNVVYISSFSKVLAPGLRVGYVIANENIINKMYVLKQFMDLGTSVLGQAIAQIALEKGVVDKNAEYAKRLYRLKKNLMIELIDSMFFSESWRSNPKGGFYIWVKLNKNIDTRKLLEQSKRNGVIFTPGANLCVNTYRCLDAMRLSYSNPSEDEIRIGIYRLSSLIREIANVS